MATPEFADFLYGACLRDWDAERERMQRYADRFDAAEQVRIVGAGTDLTLSIAGRSMKVDAGGANIPGGEFFCCPVEDSAEGDDHVHRVPGRADRAGTYVGDPPALRGRPRRRRLRRDERGRPARDARHRRGRAPPRRARDRLQPGDHAVHAQHALRREDRRHRPPRARERASTTSAARTSRGSTGTSSRTSGSGRADRARRRAVVQEDGRWLDLSERSLLRRRPVVALLAAEVVSTTGVADDVARAAVVRPRHDRLGDADERRRRRRADRARGARDPGRRACCAGSARGGRWCSADAVRAPLMLAIPVAALGGSDAFARARRRSRSCSARSPGRTSPRRR